MEKVSNKRKVKNGLLLLGGLISDGQQCYTVLELLGSGSFGQVYRCKDKCNDRVAIKIIKRQSDRNLWEVDVLNRLKGLSEFHIITLLGTFTHKNHLCLIFPSMAQSLDELVANDGELPIKGIRVILYQLFTALIKLNELQIIHTDLKPENIMLVDHVRKPFHIKVIDFGSALHHSQCVGKVVNNITTRQFRSPEVMLGIPCTETVDMWSVGCIAAELYMAIPLFPGESEYDMLKLIIQAQGFPSETMLASAQYMDYFFCLDQQISSWRLKTPEEFRSSTNSRCVCNEDGPVFDLNDMSKLYRYENKFESRDKDCLLHIIENMIELDADDRISPSEALGHDFIDMKHMMYAQDSAYYQESLKLMESCKMPANKGILSESQRFNIPEP